MSLAGGEAGFPPRPVGLAQVITQRGPMSPAVEVRPFRAGDYGLLLGRGLRRADEQEARRLLGIPAALALRNSLGASEQAFCVLQGGLACALFGLGVIRSGSGSTGIPWMVAHDDLGRNGAGPALGRVARRVVRQWLGRCRRLENYVDPRNRKALRMLDWLGFSLDRTLPLRGAGGYPFIRFWQDAPGR